MAVQSALNSVSSRSPVAGLHLLWEGQCGLVVGLAGNSGPLEMLPNAKAPFQCSSPARSLMVGSSRLQLGARNNSTLSFQCLILLDERIK